MSYWFSLWKQWHLLSSFLKYCFFFYDKTSFFKPASQTSNSIFIIIINCIIYVLQIQPATLPQRTGLLGRCSCNGTRTRAAVTSLKHRTAREHKRSSLPVALEFKACMLFRKRWKLVKFKIESSTVDLRMAERMTCANFKSLPFTVREEFLGRTNVHMHFLFYITDRFIRFQNFKIYQQQVFEAFQRCNLQ